MAEDLIRYDILAQDALRGVVRKVLAEVARTGLPGEHHFFITFATRAAGVRVSSRLLARFPEEMTIVLQHQFWDLAVTEHAFEVRLSFKDQMERLLVPFTAIKSFLDPSVQFGLQFEIVSKPEGTLPAPGDEAPAEATPPAEPPPRPALPRLVEKPADDAAPPPKAPAEGGAAQVVSLDAFRKK
jgi:hypothetical protein